MIKAPYKARSHISLQQTNVDIGLKLRLDPDFFVIYTGLQEHLGQSSCTFPLRYQPLTSRPRCIVGYSRSIGLSITASIHEIRCYCTHNLQSN